jgi:hypothetical protein
VPELPDVTVYVERLAALTVGQPLEGIRIASPFVLRTVSPSPRDLAGAKVVGVERLGKRNNIGVEPPPKAEPAIDGGAAEPKAAAAAEAAPAPAKKKAGGKKKG